MRKAIPLLILAAVTLLLSGCWRQDVVLPDIQTDPNPPEGPRPLEVEFDAVGFGGADIKEYRWEFGDGGTASGRRVSHTYEQRGTYTVQLTVVDGRNQLATTEEEVTVRRKPPVALFTRDPSYRTVASGRTITFDASESYHPDGGEMVEYQWDFGDGNVAFTAEPIVTHQYTVEGRYAREFTIELRIVDDDGNIAPAPSRRVEVRPGCPSCG